MLRKLVVLTIALVAVLAIASPASAARPATAPDVKCLQTGLGVLLIAIAATFLAGVFDMKPDSANTPFFGIRPAIVDAEGRVLEGACEGSLACSTCHVIVDGAWFPKLETPTEDEEDMLDLAFDLQETSRLCCQIIMTDALDGLVVTLPSGTRNAGG